MLRYIILMILSITVQAGGLKVGFAPMGCEQLKERTGACIEDYATEFKDVFKGYDVVMPYSKLVEVVTEVTNRFTYKTDTDSRGEKEYWSINRSGLPIVGDCEDFALAVRYELGKRGYASRIVGTSSNGDSIDHAMLIHGEYHIDNNHSKPIKYYESSYKILFLSGYKDSQGWELYPDFLNLTTVREANNEL